MAKSLQNMNEKSETRKEHNSNHFECYWKEEEIDIGLQNGSLIEVIDCLLKNCMDHMLLHND